ncbi:MAG: hypothetical protein ACYTEL_26570, partial [Planctomycetota bacterium]
PRYEYTYDDYGNLITITDKLKQTPDTNQVDANSARETTFVYDYLGNQVSRKLPSGKVETKEYNEHGQLIKSTDFKKQVTGYEYNDRGMLAVQAFYDSNSDYPDDPNWQYEFTYDNHGRRVTIDVNSFAGTPRRARPGASNRLALWDHLLRTLGHHRAGDIGVYARWYCGYGDSELLRRAGQVGQGRGQEA